MTNTFPLKVEKPKAGWVNILQLYDHYMTPVFSVSGISCKFGLCLGAFERKHSALGPDFVMLDVEDVTKPRFAELAPQSIAIPLFGLHADAESLIAALGEVGFAGDIIVLCPPLPKPKLVEAELRAMGPGKRLHLIEVRSA